ncbi:MAG TPA: methylmalonyl-CoA mutase family protein [Verrucomicrobiae bacterium]|jgi:methylmalonyl-CoA mutase|nr:methylmalonyl-CoA mutase family protein [Verrucomicrobiae bacterium]
MNATHAPAEKSRLLAEFPDVGYDDWREVVDAELKGAPFDKRMFSATAEGITLKPIYRREDVAALPHVASYPGCPPFVRGAQVVGHIKEPWAISQEIYASSPSEFNHAARNSLSRGLNALNMVLDKATRQGQDPDWAEPEAVGCGGLSIATVEDLEKALEGVDLANVSLLARTGASAMPFAALLAALQRRRKLPLSHLRGCVEMDPLGVLSHEGSLPQSLSGAYREMAALTGWAALHAPSLQTICVHGRAWHEAGGHAVQELAFSIATGAEYVRRMVERGLEINAVAPRLRFAVTVGENFFLEIAKLRALRMLWSKVVAAFNGDEEAQKAFIHVRTSHWNKTLHDPHNNVLRATVEAFGGVLGGCDSMQVGAFDEVFRAPDDASQRLARNTQLVLQRECELTHVIDPAGGSWYVESLTSDLAQRAWTLFQEVEQLGGMEAALAAGFPQKAVAATAAERLKGVTRRRDTIVGVNQYANPKEKTLAIPAVDATAFHRRRVAQISSYRTALDDQESEIVLHRLADIINIKNARLFDAAVEAAAAGATLGEIVRALRIQDRPCVPVQPVCLTRAAAPFEKLRLAAARYAVREGRAPQVFLCNLGGPKDFKGRADFSRGFFSAGGYEVLSSPGFILPDVAASAFVQSGAPIAVICSSDAQYPALVAPLVGAIRAQFPRAIIVLAGLPADQVEAHKQAGVDEFIHLRADAAELLNKFHNWIGVE